MGLLPKKIAEGLGEYLISINDNLKEINEKQKRTNELLEELIESV